MEQNFLSLCCIHLIWNSITILSTLLLAIMSTSMLFLLVIFNTYTLSTIFSTVRIINVCLELSMQLKLASDCNVADLKQCYYSLNLEVSRLFCQKSVKSHEKLENVAADISLMGEILYRLIRYIHDAMCFLLGQRLMKVLFKLYFYINTNFAY